MTPRLRKIGLTAHVAISVGWLGAVVAFLFLAVAGVNGQDTESVRGAYLAMDLIGRFVIVPMSLAALGLGLVQAIGTEWGVFRHWWVSVKLVLTVVATGVLLAKIPLMSRAAHLAAMTPLPTDELRFVGLQLLIHSAGGLLVLLAITTISIFKPWGRTRYGQRESQEPPIVQRQPGKARLGLPLIAAIMIGVLVAIALTLHLLHGGLHHHSH